MSDLSNGKDQILIKRIKYEFLMQLDRFNTVRLFEILIEPIFCLTEMKNFKTSILIRSQNYYLLMLMILRNY